MQTGRGRGGRRGGGRAGRGGRRRAARPAAGADLVGKRVLVLHAAESASENEWHIGTVEAFDDVRHLLTSHMLKRQHPAPTELM